MDRAFPTCLYCADRIGANEPVLVVEHGGERETTLASEPQLLERPRVLLVHTACVRDRRIVKASIARAR
jgi:hypothetical protein